MVGPMSLRKAQIRGLWALGALAIGLQGARAQEPTPAATPSTKPAIPATGTHASATPDSSGLVRTAATAANAAGPPTVCFKLTMRCFGNNAAPADPAQPSRAQSTSPPGTHDEGGSPPVRAHSLNLAPPDVRTVIPPEELKEPLPTEDQQEQQTDASTVEVRSDPDTPNVPGGFGALFWALRHPTQAWRIFTPVE